MTVSEEDTTPMATDLTEADVKALVDAWYHALDVHVPMEEIVPMVTTDVECQWPEGPTYGVEEFKGWYHKVTHLFFDEVHTMKSLEITPRGQRGRRQARRQLAGQGLEPAGRQEQVARAWTPARRGSSPGPKTDRGR